MFDCAAFGLINHQCHWWTRPEHVQQDCYQVS